MAQPYVSGPVRIFVGAPPVFLGTAERAPRISIRRGWEPVFNDYTGTKVPLDMIYEGEEAFITATLTRWNEPLLEAIQNVVGGLAGAAPGVEPAGTVGTLMQMEGASYPLYLQFLYGGGVPLKPAMATLPAGYRFVSAWLEGPDEIDSGTQANKRTLTWHALRAFNPLASTLVLPGLGTALAGGSLLLYDFNMTPLNGVAVN